MAFQTTRHRITTRPTIHRSLIRTSTSSGAMAGRTVPRQQNRFRQRAATMSQSSFHRSPTMRQTIQTQGVFQTALLVQDLEPTTITTGSMPRLCMLAATTAPQTHLSRAILLQRLINGTLSTIEKLLSPRSISPSHLVQDSRIAP